MGLDLSRYCSWMPVLISKTLYWPVSSYVAVLVDFAAISKNSEFCCLRFSHEKILSFEGL